MRRVFLLSVVICLLCTAARAETEITLTFGGDCVLGTREEWVGKPGTFDDCVSQKGTDWCFSGVKTVFAEDDLTLINLECVLQNGSNGHNPKKQHTFRGKPEYAEMLRDASVELVNVANNHYIDYNQSGEKSTKAALKEAGVHYCGYRNLYVFEKDGIKIGFGGCMETESYTK